MRLALIIQGPVISVGRSGRTHIRKDAEVTDADIVRHDCRADIRRLAAEAAPHFTGGVVVSTWAGDAAVDAPCPVIRSEESSVPVPRRGDDLHPLLRGNNKLKQFHLIARGLDALGDADAVLKVRTDQFLDIGRAAAELAARVAADPQRIYTVQFHTSYFFNDYYFGGATEVFADLVRSYLDDYQEMHESIHVDVPLRASLCSRHLRTLVPPTEADNPMLVEGLLKAFHYNYLGSFSGDLMASVVWRGAPLDPLMHPRVFQPLPALPVGRRSMTAGESAAFAETVAGLAALWPDGDPGALDRGIAEATQCWIADAAGPAPGPADLAAVADLWRLAEIRRLIDEAFTLKACLVDLQVPDLL